MRGDHEEVTGDQSERHRDGEELSGEPRGPRSGLWICILSAKGNFYGVSVGHDTAYVLKRSL